MGTIEVAEAADFLPVVMYTEKPSPEVIMEMHDPEMKEQLEHASSLGDEVPEVFEPQDIEIIVDDLPGAGELDPELEKSLEVDDEAINSNQTQLAADKKSKKDPRWDWEAAGPKGFIAWIKERLQGVPKHSGYDTAGIERALSYLDKLDGEISKAMRTDLDGELDADKVEEVRAQIDDGINRLHERLEKVRAKKGKKKKKAEAEIQFVKEAQKIPGVHGVVVTVDLLISRIARACINGVISAGHDLEDVFQRQVDYYELDKREKAMTMQLLSDMGYPLRQDRGVPVDEDYDSTSSNNIDFAANYQA